MTFLLVCKQKKNLDTFDGVIAALLADGHQVVLTIQERDAARDQRILQQFAHPGLRVVPCPDGRSDDWRAAAPLVRTARDWAQYSRPPYARASKLASRAATRLAREIGAAADGFAPPPVLAAPASERVQAAFARLERAIPPDPVLDEFLRTHAPDVVIVTPGLHFGSGQADLMKSARALGLPLFMLLFSWDNLSTKGAIHVAPDRLFVWNERQRREAVELHDFPADRVVVVGAPRFDAFFALRSTVSAHDFLSPLGLDPARPTLLYLCSSRFIAEDEPAFLGAWLAAIRAARAPLARCNVVIRPHPDVPFEGDAPEVIAWRGLPQATGWAHRPFDDDAAVVLRTTYRTQEAFFECLAHADAVVALNTSAELEAGIAGRPVFTVLATDRAADGQAHTLHFNYLLQSDGGFVTYAATLEEHVSQLADALSRPPASDAIRRFVAEFLRPHGDTPVAPLLARAVADEAVLALAERTRSAELTAAGGVASSVVPPAGTTSLAAGVSAQEGEDGDRSPRLLRLAPDSQVTVRATPETRRWRRGGVYQLAPAVRQWLEGDVRPGDTVYDVGAGVGAYALFGALHRGCTVVAIEPGYHAFRALCDNVVDNRCGRSVLPLPIAVGPRTGLYELDYAHAAGSDQHALMDRPWRAARDGADARYVQPVCAETLDALVERFGLPPGQALRVAVRRKPEGVLAGAAALLAGGGIRTLLCQLRSADQAPAVRDFLRPYGLVDGELTDGGDFGAVLVFARQPAGMPSGTRAVDRLRRALRGRGAGA